MIELREQMSRCTGNGLMAWIRSVFAKPVVFGILGVTLLASGCVHQTITADALYVVQRDAKKIAVVENNRLVSEIGNIGDMSHATVKFHAGKAWVISRDGMLSRIDPGTRVVEKSVKVGDSGIGFTFFPKHVIVANYMPQTVVVLDLDLRVIKTISTGSRNVGIKVWGDRAAFALMDKDEVWVVDAAKEFSVTKQIEKAGVMPFDALVNDKNYVVGFFNENKLGILNLDSLQWDTRSLGGEGGETVLKVPHFGTWGITSDTAFVPGVKERKLNLLALDTLKPAGVIDLPGLPVFAVVSPDKTLVAVNYSGDQENSVSVVDAKTRKILGTWPVGRRIMHLRFSQDGGSLFVSSYFENKIKTLKPEKTGVWSVASDLNIDSPSGIFYQ